MSSQQKFEGDKRWAKDYLRECHQCGRKFADFFDEFRSYAIASESSDREIRQLLLQNISAELKVYCSSHRNKDISYINWILLANQLDEADRRRRAASGDHLASANPAHRPGGAHHPRPPSSAAGPAHHAGPSSSAVDPAQHLGGAHHSRPSSSAAGTRSNIPPTGSRDPARVSPASHGPAPFPPGPTASPSPRIPLPSDSNTSPPSSQGSVPLPRGPTAPLFPRIPLPSDLNTPPPSSTPPPRGWGAKRARTLKSSRHGTADN